MKRIFYSLFLLLGCYAICFAGEHIYINVDGVDVGDFEKEVFLTKGPHTIYFWSDYDQYNNKISAYKDVCTRKNPWKKEDPSWYGPINEIGSYGQMIADVDGYYQIFDGHYHESKFIVIYPNFSGTCGENLTWEFDTISGNLAIYGSGTMTSHPWKNISPALIKSVTLPPALTSICDGAFFSCSSLTSITIPNSVTSIGNGAFQSCSALTSITIPNSVTSIGSSAFSDCSSLTSINIPEGVKTIEYYTFYDCYSLTSVTIPNSVTSIGDQAFYGCTALKSLTIPNSVTEIRDDAFSHCTSLEYLSIPNSVEYTYRGDYGELRYNDGYRSIMNCPNLKTLIVPADFFGVDEEFDGDYQHVKSDYFPYLPEKLESLTINDGTIHRLAWDFISRNYKTLKTIDLATTTDIAIAEEAFKNCYKLENLALPSQLEYIPYMAIAECVKLQSITIPATVTEIEDRAFENCRSIKSIIFEGAAPAQGPAHHVAATGSSLWRIGSWAFYNCHQLQNLTIPEGVTEVGDAAFYGCTYLEDMVLPSTIQEIGDNGFALCAKLQKIHVKAATPPTIQAKTFFDVNRQIPVYVPDNAVEAYKDDPYWQEFDIQGESKAPSAVDNIPSAVTNTKKIMRNGQLIILRDGKTYNTMGAEIR